MAFAIWSRRVQSEKVIPTFLRKRNEDAEKDEANEDTPTFIRRAQD